MDIRLVGLRIGKKTVSLAFHIEENDVNSVCTSDEKQILRLSPVPWLTQKLHVFARRDILLLLDLHDPAVHHLLDHHLVAVVLEDPRILREVLLVPEYALHQFVSALVLYRHVLELIPKQRLSRAAERRLN